MKEPQYHIKENEGFIRLCIRLKSFPIGKNFLIINCSTIEGTACKSTCGYVRFDMILVLFILVDGRDYYSTAGTNDTFTFRSIGQTICVTIPLIDNVRHDGKRFFLFAITSTFGIDIWIQIFIWDDEWSRLYNIR